MSASERGDDNRWDNTAISLQRADPNEGEGNVRPLYNYLPSLLPGVKTVDKDNKFLQVRVLDTMGPVAMLFQHVCGFLAETKPGENVVLSYEQMKDLGAITSCYTSIGQCSCPFV